jgi:cytochrome c6
MNSYEDQVLIMKNTIILAVTFMLAVSMSSFAADGGAAYKAKCAGCHGADGSKTNPAMGVRALSSPEVQTQSDKELIDVTAKGKGKMPGYTGKLSDDEIKATVDFIRTLKK